MRKGRGIPCPAFLILIYCSQYRPLPLHSWGKGRELSLQLRDCSNLGVQTHSQCTARICFACYVLFPIILNELIFLKTGLPNPRIYFRYKHNIMKYNTSDFILMSYESTSYQKLSLFCVLKPLFFTEPK